jgi:hypothetical protein
MSQDDDGELDPDFSAAQLAVLARIEADEAAFERLTELFVEVAFNAAGRPSITGQPCVGAVSRQNPESRILEGAGSISREVTMTG